MGFGRLFGMIDDKIWIGDNTQNQKAWRQLQSK